MDTDYADFIGLRGFFRLLIYSNFGELLRIWLYQILI